MSKAFLKEVHTHNKAFRLQVWSARRCKEVVPGGWSPTFVAEGQTGREVAMSKAFLKEGL